MLHLLLCVCKYLETKKVWLTNLKLTLQIGSNLLCSKKMSKILEWKNCPDNVVVTIRLEKRASKMAS